METWKPIPGWEGLYEVSDHGRVKRLERSVIDSLGRTKLYPEAVLEGGVDSLGYRRHKLRKASRSAELKTHQLVAWAFLGPQSKGLEVCHNDGNKLNNTLSNLRYDTRKGIAADRVSHGTHPAGTRNPSAKLSVEQVLALRKAKPGFINSLCRQFGVTYQTAKAIRRNQSWSHIA